MATDASTLRLASPAKVNLALSVGALLSSGLHPIASWMVAVHFADRVELRPSDGPSHFELALDPGAPVARAIDWPIEKDLGFRAHRLLEECVGRPLPVRVSVAKRIPAGAGLGGGSGNAAAVLVGLDRLFDLGLDTEALMALGRRLGSDVAFHVAAARGQPSALVRGLGETIEPLPRSALLYVVLIFPPFGCPTGEVYRAFDALRGDAGPPDAPRVRELASRWPLPQDGPFNDLADAACAVRPPLARLRRQAAEALGLPVHITGSGSTMFVIAPSELTAKVLARKVTALTGLPAVATRTLAPRGTVL